MNLLYPVSQLTMLRTRLRQNPEATGVILTSDELVDIIGELLESSDSNAVLIGKPSNKIFMIDGRTIEVKLECVG